MKSRTRSMLAKRRRRQGHWLFGTRARYMTLEEAMWYLEAILFDEPEPKTYALNRLGHFDLAP